MNLSQDSGADTKRRPRIKRYYSNLDLCLLVGGTLAYWRDAMSSGRLPHVVNRGRMVRRRLVERDVLCEFVRERRDEIVGLKPGALKRLMRDCRWASRRDTGRLRQMFLHADHPDTELTAMLTALNGSTVRTRRAPRSSSRSGEADNLDYDTGDGEALISACSRLTSKRRG